MGRTQISNISYDRETYFNVWLKQIVANLVPDGFRKLEVIDAIGDENGVALMMEGEADGINGLYDNKYVFIFKFKDGKIATLHEYNSDLLVATRLYKQKLVADD
jgi:ketosteroid isomerase-like protein